MDSVPPIETVYQAIFTLYHDQDSSGKEKASFWLGELQRSVYGWKVADDLLQRKTDVESCYFAAQTMRTKIQFAFHELPTTAHASLRDSLLNHLSQVNEQTNNVIITQLCLALADLALQMASWQNPIQDLITRFSQHQLYPLLEILTVFPEEVNSRSLRLGANRRSEVICELNGSAKLVSDFLHSCLATEVPSQQTHVRVLRCFTSWVLIQAIPLTNVAEHVVVVHAFQCLASPQTSTGVHEAATDCICALLQCLEENNNQQGLETFLFTGVQTLQDSYHFSVAQEDTEKSLNYCRIFTELAEAFLDKIVMTSNVKDPHFSVKSLDMVLICVGHHEYEVAEITFNFWYRLSEELYQKSNDALTALFKPFIERLVEALCRHCQMEPDHEGILEDGDEFGDFRLKVAELIKDVVFIVGSSTCFRQMFLHLQSGSATWDSSEAALFIMQAVAKNILPKENEVVPKVVEAILNLPENTHLAVRHTSILLLGELCEWIEQHPQSLEPILNFLLFCLQQPPLATVAAKALQSICSECRDHMGVHFNGLVQIIRSLDNFRVSNEAAVGLLKGVSVILGRMPADQIQAAMKEICWVQINPLCHLVQGDVKTEKGTKTDPVLWLDRLAVIFRHTNPVVQNGEVHPCQAVVTEMWPVLSDACNKYKADLRVMERCCRCLRFAVRCVGKQSAPLLEPLVKQIVSLYQEYPHSCFLYLGSILVDEYAGEAGCIPGLLEMLKTLIVPTFKLLEEPNGLKNHPDTVDDFFRLCARFLQRAPVSFLQCDVLNSILQCALLACMLDHRDANASVMKFFYDLIHSGRTHEDRADFEARKALIQGLLQQNGQQLLTNLIQACIFCLPSYLQPDVADVIMELMLTDRAEVCRWLETVLKALPTQNSGGTVTATQKQLVDFHRAVTAAETSKAVSHALREFTQLYR